MKFLFRNGRVKVGRTVPLNYIYINDPLLHARPDKTHSNFKT